VLLAGVLAAGGVDTGGVWAPLALAGAVLVLVILWRFWKLRVDDLGDGVRIVNWTGTFEVPWDEIDRFEFDGVVSLRRRDMRSVPLSAFPFPSRDVFGIGRGRNHAAFLALESIRKKRRRQARKKSAKRS
jgi:Bacterial PH domain